MTHKHHIRSNHPVREAVSSLSSGSHYYESIAEWWGLVTAELLDFGFITASITPPEVHTDEGWTLVHLRDLRNRNLESCLRLSWYRMPSSRWEVVCYVT